MGRRLWTGQLLLLLRVTPIVHVVGMFNYTDKYTDRVVATEYYLCAVICLVTPCVCP